MIFGLTYTKKNKKLATIIPINYYVLFYPVGFKCMFYLAN